MAGLSTVVSRGSRKALSSNSEISPCGIHSKRAEPRSSLVPDLLTALVTKPAERPNSAETAPRLMLNSAMSSSLTSVLR